MLEKSTKKVVKVFIAKDAVIDLLWGGDQQTLNKVFFVSVLIKNAATNRNLS